jgi:hypothetical protein
VQLLPSYQNPTFDPWKISKKNKEEEKKENGKLQKPSHMWAYGHFTNYGLGPIYFAQMV